jgi:DNA topoisomerase-3
LIDLWQSQGKSKYNPIFEFNYQVNNQQTTYRVTSVLGHIMGIEFPESTKDWFKTDIESLFHT